MAIRTIPSILPVVSASEIAIGRPLKSDIFRRFAQAQNYLWANIRRAYAFWANDGEGFTVSGKSIANTGVGTLQGGWEDPAIVPMPGGGYPGMCLATFAFPPSPVGNTRAKFQGRGNFQRDAGTVVIRVTLHELDNAETFAGLFAEISYSTNNAAWDWSFEIDVPTNRPIIGKLWVGGLLGSSTGAAWDAFDLYCVSARWLCPSEFASASTGLLPFEPSDSSDATADRSVDVAILDQVRRQLASLAGSRGQTEILQTWFGKTSKANTSYIEVGRYTVYVSTAVNSVTVRIYALTTLNSAPHVGAVRILWDGVQKVVHVINHAQYGVAAYDVAFDPGTSDAEHVLTIEAGTSLEVADYGCEVLGVFAWESGISTAGWPDLPLTNFTPLDESRLKANDTISADLEFMNSARTGLAHLIRNNLWLAKNRLRSLVGDWRRRVHKRIADEGGLQVGSSAGGIWDWTRGLQNGPGLQISKPRNITVRGDLTVNDGWGRGAANHDSLDGYGASGTGYSDSGASGVTSIWPSSQIYRGHGRRLSVVYCAVPAGISMHASDASATSSVLARAARKRPAIMGPTFNQGTHGPTAEESNWKNRGRLELDWPTTGGLVFPITSTSPAVVDDHQLRWLPAQSKLSYIGEGKIRGRLPIAFIPMSSANLLEGTLFEVQLSALLVMDDPLPLASLALLA
jgi:hypothetical protein